MSPRRSLPTKEEQKSGLPMWAIVIGIGALMIIAAGVLYVVQTPTASKPATSNVATSGKTKGNAEAKISFVEFGDFKWVYCIQFGAGAGRQIADTYVKNGQVKFTYKHFLVVDPNGESLSAANASECANEQGKFWDYHDRLVAEAITGRSQFNPTNLKRYAAELGLDATKFNSCLDTNKFASVIQADISEGARLGISSTPSFFINGNPIKPRSLDFTEFARVIDPLVK